MVGQAEGPVRQEEEGKEEPVVEPEHQEGEGKEEPVVELEHQEVEGKEEPVGELNTGEDCKMAKAGLT